MNERRKLTEEHIVKHISMMEPGGTNAARYREMFAKMSDEEFDAYMKVLDDEEEVLDLYTPNMVINLEMEDLIATAKALGLPLREPIKRWDPTTKRWYTTPHSYLILTLPVRRLIQTWEKKISVPSSDKKIGSLTGQVVRPDKGSSISMVESQTLNSKGLALTLAELTRIRGGDITGYASLKASLMETGSGSLTATDLSGTIRSALVTQQYLRAMHLENNLTGQ